MKKQEILEGNKLIANFDGETFYKSYPGLNKKDIRYGVIYVPDLGLTDCKYHSSWDWLIPVVQKINGMASKYPLRVADVMLSYCRVDIKELHEHVVKFIKWYNDQSK